MMAAIEYDTGVYIDSPTWPSPTNPIVYGRDLVRIDVRPDLEKNNDWEAWLPEVIPNERKEITSRERRKRKKHRKKSKLSRKRNR